MWRGGYVGFITEEIRCAVGAETDAVKASILNVKQSVSKITNSLNITFGLGVRGAFYHPHRGLVFFVFLFFTWAARIF